MVRFHLTVYELARPGVARKIKSFERWKWGEKSKVGCISVKKWLAKTQIWKDED